MSDSTAATQQATQQAGDVTQGDAGAGDAQQQQATTDDQGADKGNQGDEVDWKAKFEAEQKVRKDWERKAKGDAGTLKQQIEELQAKIDGREAEFAQAQKEQAVKDEAIAAANQRILNAEVRAAAKGRLANEADALAFLDLSEFEVSDDGQVDAAAIQAAIGALLEDRPYLAAQGGTTTFESPGSHRQEKAGQVTRAQLEQMTPDEINAARAEGRLNALLGINK